MPGDTRPRSEGQTMTASQALRELRSQHDVLRELLDSCEQLADELDVGKATPNQLHREVARLRTAFDVHNDFEEQLLRPLLRQNDAFAEARITRLVDDHVHEHRTMRAQLGTEETAQLRDVIDTLRAHLEAEERYLLTDRVLRDDIVTVEGAG